MASRDMNGEGLRRRARKFFFFFFGEAFNTTCDGSQGGFP